MKNEKPAVAAGEDPADSSHKPEHGADSQLHCYNAVSWRLAEMFGDEDEKAPDSPKQK
ncbi:MAG: hypothetical protein ACRD3E_17300 [Terriglobales bacterium]